MGWWGGNPYDNDAACDWADRLLRGGGYLGVVEGTLERALAHGLPDAWQQADAFAAVGAAALVTAEARGAPAPALGDDRVVARLRGWAAAVVAADRADQGGGVQAATRPQHLQRLERLAAQAVAASALVRAATHDGRHYARQADASRAASLAALDAIDEALGTAPAASSPSDAVSDGGQWP